MSQFIIDEERPWLGGAMRGGDYATYYPELWACLVADCGVQSVLDVGCGEGHALKFFRDKLGCRVAGYDGIPQDDPDIYEHDFTRGPADDYASSRNDWDLAWCCEFVEHVEERFIPNFLATFKCADLVLMTHAEPGQAGWHHVNMQPSSYWAGVMAAIGYQLDGELTSVTRELAAENKSPYNHYLRSGLALKRYE